MSGNECDNRHKSLKGNGGSVVMLECRGFLPQTRRLDHFIIGFDEREKCDNRHKSLEGNGGSVVMLECRGFLPQTRRLDDFIIGFDEREKIDNRHNCRTKKL